VSAWQFILLTIVHATRSKGLSSLDVATSSSLSTLTATEEGKCGKDDVSETHNTDGSDESDDETLVLTVFAKVEVTLHAVVVVAGSGAVVVVVAGSGIVVVVVVGRGIVG
jgi:hypothetical protein